MAASRITVRPEAPPLDGRHIFAPKALEALHRARGAEASVIIVDEGPDPSGARFLATGEAVVAMGIPKSRVLFVGSRFVEPERRSAPDAADRWRSFRAAVAPSSVFAPLRSGAWGRPRDVSGGAWRHLHYTSSEAWPAVVEGLERRKLVAGGRLFKFEGLGSSGLAARHRACALAAEGIALDPCDEGDGWTSYPWTGRPLRASDLDVGLLDLIARYCARRPSLCPLVSAESDLAPVVMKNAAALLGSHAPLPTLEGALAIERIATTDSRLAPHEWLRLDDGSIRKMDAISHGDDFFFPGPTDIAWDLAGAIVEWEMDRAAREHFLSAYRRASGDDARRRIEPWIIAYATLRGALHLFALETCSAAEAPRLAREVDRYRSVLLAVSPR